MWVPLQPELDAVMIPSLTIRHEDVTVLHVVPAPGIVVILENNPLTEGETMQNVNLLCLHDLPPVGIP